MHVHTHLASVYAFVWKSWSQNQVIVSASAAYIITYPSARLGQHCSRP